MNSNMYAPVPAWRRLLRKEDELPWEVVRIMTSDANRNWIERRLVP